MEMLVVVISILVLLLLTSFGFIGFIALKNYLDKKFEDFEEGFTQISNQVAGVSEGITLIRESLKQQENNYKVLLEISKHITQIQSPARKNDIEKREPEEIPLDESMRIPIINGVNVRMEDENQSFPLDIITYGQKDN